MKIFLIILLIGSLSVVFLSSNFVQNVYAQGAPPSSGGGGCSTDCTHPTMGINDRGFRHVDNGFAIDGNRFNVDHYFQVIPTHTFITGEQIEIVLHIYENSGTDNLQHVELSLATYDKIIQGIKTEDSVSTMIWDKSDGVTLIDKTNLLYDDNFTVLIESVDDNTTRLIFSFQVVTSLESSTIKVKMWDIKKNSWNNYFENAILVVEKSLDVTDTEPTTSDGVTDTEPTTSDGVTYTESSKIFHNKNDEEKEAIRFFKDLSYIESEERIAWELLAFEYLRYYEFDKAIEIYEQLFHKYPDDPILLNDLGRVYSLMGNDIRALEYYQKSIEIDRYNELIITNNAISLFNIGRHEESLIEIDRALSINPDYEVALGMKVLVLTVMDRSEDAAEIIDHVVMMNPSNVDVLTSKAIIAHANGNLIEAKSLLDRVIRIDPFYYALLLDAKVTAELGDLNSAKNSFTTALELTKNESLTSYTSSNAGILSYCKDRFVMIPVEATPEQISAVLKEFTIPGCNDNDDDDPWMSIFVVSSIVSIIGVIFSIVWKIKIKT